MPELTRLSPDLSRSVSALARALVAAARSWSLYPGEHPAVRASVDRLRAALASAISGQALSFGVTPDTLLVQGVAVTAEGPVGEAAQWLHQHDILQLTFAGDVPAEALQALLALLADDIASVRARGGPAAVWRALPHGSIAIEQIDFTSVFDDRQAEHPARQKDDIWRSIVGAVTNRRKITDEATQRRMLDIARDSLAVGALAQDVMAPNVAADGSPMLTSQAAAVVAAYRHLVSIVDVMDPANRTEVMQNLIAATATLDPRVIMQMLSAGADEAGAAAGVTTAEIRRGIAAGFDDAHVAQLLATTLAIDGQATDRLAGVFDTIAPDAARKKRVLTLTKTLLGETQLAASGQFEALWRSMEELLLGYNERPFVSASYRTALDGAAARAAAMATDVPAELTSLIETLGQDNVRKLSARLLIDLLTLEHDATRAPELARDVAALAEDLLLAGDYASALTVAAALAQQAATPGAVAQSGSRAALDGLVDTIAFRETADALGDMTAEDAQVFAALCARVGPAATEALRDLIAPEAETAARRRAAEIIASYGAPAVMRIAPLIDHRDWFTRRNAADLLGRIGVAAAVPLLQPLLRGGEPRVMRAAVRALSHIDDPAAARAVHTVLRSAGGEHRRAVVAALVEERDARVGPVLARILDESDPFGSDHHIVLETLGAMGDLGRDDAVPHVAQVMRRGRWFARKKTRVLKETSIATLRRIGSPVAAQALADAAAQGDRLLRKLARAATVAHA